MASSSVLALGHGALSLPTFLPDATRAVVRALDAADLEACGVAALMMNVFHVMQRPGSGAVRALGGLHALSGWSGPIATDSGGFQAWSIVRNDPRLGRVSDDGLTWRRAAGEREFRLTPEKSVQLQLAYGSDLLFCLDDCTHPDDPLARQEEAVKRTVAWARRSRAEFDRLLDEKRLDAGARPLLFGVIQGGTSHALRERCAAELCALGFDGYGFGGFPLDSEGRLLEETLAYTRGLVPRELPLHALGVGHPRSIATCTALGYGLFDSALPTRDARRGRLYCFEVDPAGLELTPGGEWLSTCYIEDKRHSRTRAPISLHCDALCCRRYSTAYLHHLFELEDALYSRLATLHNLRFMARLCALLRGEGSAVR